MSAATLLTAVKELALLAGDIALRAYGSQLTVDRKADGSEVTTADRDAESAAREWIAARFPDDGILGEELGEVNPGARRRWIVDPIDGTAAFIRCVPFWGTLVAVAEGDQVLAGAIHCPAVRELVAAAVGEGCWWNGSRARVSGVHRLDEAVVLTTSERFPASVRERERGWRRLAEEARIVRGWGDCYGYLLVATGRAEVMVDPVLSPWDSAALMPVITEAGGVFTDWSGQATAFGGSAIATNAALAASARASLRGVAT
jgi:histidinol-phosphatase